MAFKNFAYSTVLTAPSPATSGTSLVVQSADGAKFPVHPFRATVWPAGVQPTSANAEIIEVSSKSTDTFTIVRAKESSSARTIVVGDQIAMTETTSLQPAGMIQAWAARIAPVGWLNCDGSAVSRTTYTDLFAAISPSLGTFTVTIATPGVVSLTAHGLSTGDQVYLTNSGGALPTGLSQNTLYYAIRIDANSFNLATSRANAYAATKIATSGTQSGTHTAWDCPYGLGDGSTTFTLPDIRGRTPAGLDTTGGTAAGRLALANSASTYGNLGASGGAETASNPLSTAGGAMFDLDATHTYVNRNGPVPSGSPAAGNVQTATWGGGSATVIASSLGLVGSTDAGNNVAPTQLINYVIKM